MNKLKSSKVQLILGLAVLCLFTASTIIIIKLKSDILGGQATGTAITTGSGLVSDTPTQSIPSATQLVQLTPTPTNEPRSTPTTITTDTDYNLMPADTINVTQTSPDIQSPSAEDDVFLYKDVIVTLAFDLVTSTRTRAIAYLNLDDLESNGFANSDVMISASTGSGGTFFELDPVNNALDYPGQTVMDYASCVSHLSEFGNYFGPETRVSYCIRTDERRIGIIQYVPDSDRVNHDVWKRSYRVTVYKQKIGD